MNSILIKNGRVLDPASKTDDILDVFIENGTISRVEKNISVKSLPPHQVFDAKDCYVMPGLLDVHVHLRDPGLTYKEDLKTGTRSAARGGFTGIVAMANTSPVVDSPEIFTEIQERVKKDSPIAVYQAASLSKGMEGKELSPIAELKKAGVQVLSEDGKTIMNAQLFREAMVLAAKYHLPVLDHCEDLNMKGSGSINEGIRSAQLGLEGISNAVEDVIIARDILIAKETGARLHICHCSTRDSVYMIEKAKEEGLPVTGEVCPHHFTLTDEDIVEGDSNYKMAPPLRSKSDKRALIHGLSSGILDCISSDHAPHAPQEKGNDISRAAFGIVGLETSVPLTITQLIRPGFLTPLQMADRMSYSPAKMMGLDKKGRLQPGADGDITIIDPNYSYTIDKEQFVSKGRNTPFHGKEVYGKVLGTIYNGQIVYRES